jgi:uncharacterized protein (TIGR02268 family)
MLVLATVAGMTAVAGGPDVERQLRQRHITLSAEGSATAHAVHVAAGTATVLLFDSPVLPASLELGAARERFERIDLTERALILMPRMELTPHERIPLTLRFADGLIPHQVTLALVTEPSEVDLQVRVFRTALAPEALVEHLGAVRARCEDSGRFSNLLFSRDVGSGIAVEKPDQRTPGAKGPSMLQVVDMRVFAATDLVAIAVTLLLAENQPPWRPGRVEVLGQDSGKPVPVRAVDLDVQALKPGVVGRLVLELRTRPSSPDERVRINVHELGGTRLLELHDVPIPPPPSEVTP